MNCSLMNAAFFHAIFPEGGEAYEKKTSAAGQTYYGISMFANDTHFALSIYLPLLTSPPVLLKNSPSVFQVFWRFSHFGGLLYRRRIIERLR